MLSLFRRLIYSRFGAVVALIVLVVLALAFVLGDVGGLSQGFSGAREASVATINGRSITVGELRDQVRRDFQSFRQQQPGHTMQQYLDASGLDISLNRLVASFAVEAFARKYGMGASKKQVDQKIAAIPDVLGRDGKFSKDNYQQLLARFQLTDKKLREELARSILLEQLTLPNAGATQVPEKLAAPYAALLLEKRYGQVAFIPARAIGAGTVPTAAELKTFYQRQRARYRVPERRALRYAIIAPDTLKTQATPSSAELDAAYRAQAARFAARETRTLQQVVVTQAAPAQALAAKVKAGTPIAAAARAIGLEAATLTAVDQAGYAGQTSADLAKQVFALPQGGVSAPIKGPLGYTIVQVQKVERLAATPEAQARATLSEELAKAKLTRLLSEAQEQIGDAIDEKATFESIVTQRKLAVQTVPPITAQGIDPVHPERQPNALLRPLIDTAFKVDPEEGPQLVPLQQDGSFALLLVERVLPPFFPPLADIGPAVARDFTIDRAQRKARAVAVQVIAAVSKGMPLAQALQETGLQLPPIQPLEAARAQLETLGNRAPPPVTLAFAMKEKTAKLQAAPGGAGWLIVSLDRIERAKGSITPAIVAARRAELGRDIGNEYLEQFVRAVRAHLGVRVNDGEVSKLRAELLGSGS